MFLLSTNERNEKAKLRKYEEGYGEKRHTEKERINTRLRPHNTGHLPPYNINGNRSSISRSEDQS